VIDFHRAQQAGFDFDIAASNGIAWNELAFDAIAPGREAEQIAWNGVFGYKVHAIGAGERIDAMGRSHPNRRRGSKTRQHPQAPNVQIERDGQALFRLKGNDAGETSETIFNLYGAFRNAKAPIIGVVQGRAVGLGCALAALCDITIAGENARFQFPETAHRIMPTIAFSALVDRVPRKAATYMIYSTAEIDAAKALAFGLVSDVVPAQQLNSHVDSLAEHFKKMPLPAVFAVKEYARTAFDIGTRAATDFARNLHATVNSFSGMRS